MIYDQKQAWKDGWGQGLKQSLIALAYQLLSALFHLPLIFGIRTFPDGDFTRHFLPFSLFHQQALLAGHLPVWNPYTYSGHPFLADVQAAVFYPLNNLLLLLTLPMTEPNARLYWLQIEAILHIGLAGFFTYLFIYTLTQQRWAAFIGGTIFAFSGYLTGYPPLQLAILRTAIWLPLVLNFLWHAFQKPSQWRWWIGASLAYTCAFLAGHAQTFLHISYVVIGWIVVCFIAAMRSEKPSFQGRTWFLVYPRLTGIVAFCLISIGLSAAQLLPSLEFMQLSVRANVDYAYVSSGFPLRDTWQLLLPGVLTHFSPLYIGIVGLGLASFSLSTFHSPLSIVRYFWILALVGLLLSYGENGFLYPLFYHLAPGWQLFRGQERTAYLVAFSLSMLAGIGMATLSQMPLGQRRRIVFTFAALPIAAVYSFGLLWQLGGHTAIGQTQYLLIAAITLILAMAFALLLWREGWSRRRWHILLLLVVANLFWANMTTNLSEFGPAHKAILAPEMEALQGAIQSTKDGALSIEGRAYNEYRVYEDYGMRQRIEDVWGSSPLRLAQYDALFDEFPLDRMWQLTGVQHLLTWRRELFVTSQLLAEFPQATDTTYLHKLIDPQPRAWLVPKIHVATDKNALKLLGDHDFDLQQIAVVSAETFWNMDTLQAEKKLRNMESPIHVIASQEPSSAIIQVQRLASNQLHIEVETSGGGLLVINENWMPGWQMRNITCITSLTDSCHDSVLGIPHLFPVNHTFIGIPLPMGQHSFDLVYWPDSIRYGLWISIFTLIIILIATGWHKKKSIKHSNAVLQLCNLQP